MTSEEFEQLKTNFWQKHRECEQAAYAAACAAPLGADRVRFFELYEIIRTAPRAVAS